MKLNTKRNMYRDFFQLFETKRISLRWMIVACFIAGSSLNALEIKNDLEAINLAGSERMMSMRMLKDYILVAMNNSYRNPQKDLQAMMKRFEETQSALEAYVKDPQIASRFKAVDQRWSEAKKMLKSPAKKEEASKYFETMTALKNAANEATVSLAKNSKHGTSQTVNMAGRLRAISQTLAALYMLKTWAADNSPDSMKKAMKIFRESLDFLKKELGNDPKVKKFLKNMEKNYLFFSMMEDAGVFTPTLVIKRTDKMLEQADELTRYLVKKQTKGGE
ncbi:type IV pili methyl-accepting chemotaxis transducer N-terminal domain-containing protein [Nitratifractor sp.]